MTIRAGRGVVDLVIRAMGVADQDTVVEAEEAPQVMVVEVALRVMGVRGAVVRDTGAQVEEDTAADLVAEVTVVVVGAALPLTRRSTALSR